MVWQIADNRKQAAFHLFIGLFIVASTVSALEFFGAANAFQVLLIATTLVVGVFSYGKQIKSTIEQSVDRLPEVQVGEFVIMAIVFDIKLWRPIHSTLQFKLYRKTEFGLSPADMEEFLNEHFDCPSCEFKNTADIATKTDYPSRVNIEGKPFLDPEGLRLRTKSFESTQLRRLAEQTMWKISEQANKNQREQPSPN